MLTRGAVALTFNANEALSSDIFQIYVSVTLGRSINSPSTESKYLKSIHIIIMQIESTAPQYYKYS